MEVSVSGYYAWRQRLTNWFEAEKVSEFNQGLLLGKSKAIWNAKNQSSFSQIRSQSWTLEDSEIDARGRLKSHAAKEFSAQNN